MSCMAVSICHFLADLTFRRFGLPKKVETYLFVRIVKVDDFRSRLNHLVPLITTCADVAEDREKIHRHKKDATETGKLMKLSGVNIAFSQKGLEQVSLVGCPSQGASGANVYRSASERMRTTKLVTHLSRRA